jgi:hypothetical protein
MARNFFNVVAAACVGTLASCASVKVADQSRHELAAARVTSGPVVDGSDDDSAWAQASPLALTVERKLPPNKGTTGKALIKAAHTDTHLYLLLKWEDSAADLSHKTWVWDPSKRAYEEGADREDMAAVAFALSGPFTADMLAPVDAVWDVWHWKASRTNPQGYAMDKTHRYMRAKPDFKANEHQANDGKPIWITRPEDAGDSVEAKRKAPGEFEGERVPQYVAATPTGSAADVIAKGQWANGWWTLEFARRLDTGHADDAVFGSERCHRMAVATFDRTGDMDKASDLILLRFEGSSAPASCRS